MSGDVSVVYSQVVGSFRGYLNDAAQAYEQRRRFIGVTTVSWLGDDETFLQGALINEGKGHSMLQAMLISLKAMGARIVRLKRARPHKLPFGRVIDEGVFEDTWEIDLLTEQLEK